VRLDLGEVETLDVMPMDAIASDANGVLAMLSIGGDDATAMFTHDGALLPRGDHPHIDRRTNHSCFVSPDLRQGILTYLSEDSLCVFGRDLLAAVESRRPTLLAKRRRQDGRAVRDG
jgi:hypothetical protein